MIRRKHFSTVASRLAVIALAGAGAIALSLTSAGCGEVESSSGSAGSDAGAATSNTAGSGGSGAVAGSGGATAGSGGATAGSGGAGATGGSGGAGASGGAAGSMAGSGGSAGCGEGGSGATGGSGGTGGGGPVTVELYGAPCPPSFVTDIAACADELLADPGSGVTWFIDAIYACSEPAALADAFDAACAGVPAPIYCNADYNTVVADLNEACIVDSVSAFAKRTCVLGANYKDSLDAERLLVLSKEALDAASPLTPLEADQIVAAVAFANPAVTTAAEAFANVDAGEMDRFQLADRYNGQLFTEILYGAGDNPYGRFFHGGTANPAANIQDYDLYQCNAAPGEGGESCGNDFMCSAPLGCAGLTACGSGKCALTAMVPKEGDACVEALDCAPAAYCAGLSTAPNGLCVAPWKTGLFRDIAFAGLPSGGELTRMMEVKGLAAAPLDVLVSVVVRHPDASELTVTLTDPSGTQVIVFSGNPGGTDLVLKSVALPFAGGVIANGDWTLRVADKAGGATGWLEQWKLFVSSH